MEYSKPSADERFLAFHWVNIEDGRIEMIFDSETIDIIRIGWEKNVRKLFQIYFVRLF